MKTYFLFIFLISNTLWAKPAPEARLLELVHSHQNAPTFELWHETRESLETEGYQIWLANTKATSFCKKIQSWKPEDQGLLSHWKTEFCSLADTPRTPLTFNQGVFASVAGLEVCDPNKVKQKKLGPTVSVNLDTTGGPRLVRGNLPRCHVAFTFDDGPHPKYTAELLEVLEAENVLANYFMVGRNVDRYPELPNLVADMGHIVGNHSYSHKNFRKISNDAGIKEIVGGFKSLLGLWDFTTPLFRFPYGAFTEGTRKYNQDNDVAEFFWNMDSLDWKLKKPSELYRRVLREIEREKRGILLFHDIHPQTVDIMPDVLVALRKAGYTTAVFVPEELIED